MSDKNLGWYDEADVRRIKLKVGFWAAAITFVLTSAANWTIWEYAIRKCL